MGFERGENGVLAPCLAVTSIPEIYTETEDPEIIAFQQHQNNAAKPSWAEAARTLMATAR